MAQEEDELIKNVVLPVPVNNAAKLRYLFLDGGKFV